MKTFETEYLIVGAGIAGIVCAIDLLEQGKKVTIVDRDSAENIGGLARWAFGGMFFVDSKQQKRAGIQDSYEQAKSDWWSCAQFDQSNLWGPRWADQFLHLCTSHGHRWLHENGIRFLPVINWAERGMLRPGNSVPRFHMVWGTGFELARRLVSQLKSHRASKGLTFLFNHRVSALTEQSDRIAGVSGVDETTAEDFTMKADVTIIATGGINGSIEKVRAHWYKPWGTPPKVILNGAHEYALGDLHDAAEQVNGSVVNLDLQWNYAAGIKHYKPRHSNHGLSLVPGKSQLWVNYQGRRFGPPPLMSPFDTRYLVEQICREPVKYSWQILNHKIANKEFSISGSEHNSAIRDRNLLQLATQILLTGSRKLVGEISRECEDFIIADGLPELVEKMNALTGESHVDFGSLQSEIHAYDAQIDLPEEKRTDEQIKRILEVRKYRGDRFRTCNLQRILDPKAGPLVAIRSFVLSRKSLGGIETDLQCRVLSKANAAGEQHPISDLYAIGEAAGFGGGGMHGQGSLEGTFLAGCVITARVCAAALAGRKLG